MESIGEVRRVDFDRTTVDSVYPKKNHNDAFVYVGQLVKHKCVSYYMEQLGSGYWSIHAREQHNYTQQNQYA
jgi:hypothetical protein